MANNPNPTRISSALWWLWSEIDKFEPSAQYGGSYTNKPGYHNYRAALRATDYSVEDVSHDRKGSSAKTAGLDVTMSTSAMIKYSKRLDAAMRARDKRLFINGVPILREYIGTKDGKTVHCYVLTGGRAMGLAGDSGPDAGRSKTHLWHVHLSFIREFAESMVAMERVLSVWKGELYSAWAKRHNVGVAPKPKPTPAKPVAKPAPKPTPKPVPTKLRNGSRELKKGMKGSDVKFVQTWIGAKRMGKADGIAGDKFEAGVRWYQGVRGLSKDGKVGRRTWAAMKVRATF